MKTGEFRTVLIADDEESVLSLIAEVLGDLGHYRILCARDGEEALRIARSDNPDLILLDVMLPKMDGNEVCRQVKTDPATARTRVLMLSGMAQRTDAQISRNNGADAYMTKPFSSVALLSKVDELTR
jgi:two-component system, OmpR family, alkaline phosphatase synthesis response regulator PhoP